MDRVRTMQHDAQHTFRGSDRMIERIDYSLSGLFRINAMLMKSINALISVHEADEMTAEPRV